MPFFTGLGKPLSFVAVFSDPSLMLQYAMTS